MRRKGWEKEREREKTSFSPSCTLYTKIRHRYDDPLTQFYFHDHFDFCAARACGFGRFSTPRRTRPVRNAATAGRSFCRGAASMVGEGRGGPVRRDARVV